ncbi:MAG: hypothetical protein ACKO3P_05445, partial [Planctomycetaceae bacterium]
MAASPPLPNGRASPFSSDRVPRYSRSMNPIRLNPARQLLLAGGTIFSSSIRRPEPGLCELLGYAGFDFVLLD